MVKLKRIAATIRSLFSCGTNSAKWQSPSFTPLPLSRPPLFQLSELHEMYLLESFLFGAGAEAFIFLFRHLIKRSLVAVFVANKYLLLHLLSSKPIR